MKALASRRVQLLRALPPGGMKVYGGSVILEPGLIEADFKNCAKRVWLAKAGFGAVKTPFDYAPHDHMGQGRRHDHDGSIPAARRSPGLRPISADHLLAMQPDVSFHVNGGPVAMPDADFRRIVNDSTIALQVCTAGNLRTTLLWAARRQAWRLRPLPDRHRYADRQRHHAARHALHHLALASLTDMPVERSSARRPATMRAFTAQFRLPARRKRRRRGADRCPAAAPRKCARRDQHGDIAAWAPWLPKACRASSGGAATRRAPRARRGSPNRR